MVQGGRAVTAGEGLRWDVPYWLSFTVFASESLVLQRRKEVG